MLNAALNVKCNPSMITKNNSCLLNFQKAKNCKYGDNSNNVHLARIWGTKKYVCMKPMRLYSEDLCKSLEIN